MPPFFPRDVLDEVWDLIESVSGGFSYLLFLFGDDVVIEEQRGNQTKMIKSVFLGSVVQN